MNYRKRPNDIATLAALVVVGLVFIPRIRLLALLLVIVGVGVAFGLLLYRRISRSDTDQDVLHHRLVADAVSARSHQPPANDIIARLRTIDWFKFEKVIAAAYKNLGYTVTRRGGANPDGGIDLLLENGTGRVAVQCKQWHTWKIRERTVREFLGALTHAKIPKDVIVTLCGHTSDAQRLAQAHGIEILDEAALAELLRAGNAGRNPEILAALNDDRKVCPKCESEMLLRTAMKGSNPGSQFWGCAAYPRCRYTMPAVQKAG